MLQVKEVVLFINDNLTSVLESKSSLKSHTDHPLLK